MKKKLIIILLVLLGTLPAATESFTLQSSTNLPSGQTREVDSEGNCYGSGGGCNVL